MKLAHRLGLLQQKPTGFRYGAAGHITGTPARTRATLIHYHTGAVRHHAARSCRRLTAFTSRSRRPSASDARTLDHRMRHRLARW
ncbi:MAG: hypothetical protein ACKV19_25580 [Verrucomicrobiales bacterium]